MSEAFNCTTLSNPPPSWTPESIADTLRPVLMSSTLTSLLIEPHPDLYASLRATLKTVVPSLPNLKSLAWYSGYHHNHLTFVPLLEQSHPIPNFLDILLPILRGAPGLENLEIQQSQPGCGTGYHLFDFMEAAGPVLPNLKKLKIDGCDGVGKGNEFLDHAAVGDLVRNCPHLVALSMEITYEHLDAITSHLSKLNHLNTLLLRFMSPNEYSETITPAQLSKFRALASTLRKSLRNLRVVQYMENEEDRQDVKTWRITEDAGQDEGIVEVDCVGDSDVDEFFAKPVSLTTSWIAKRQPHVDV